VCGYGIGKSGGRDKTRKVAVDHVDNECPVPDYHLSSLETYLKRAFSPLKSFSTLEDYDSRL
jgi:hypothetical protein